MKKILFFLLFCLSTPALPAQKKAIIEKIWCRSIKGPEILYFQKQEIRRTFAAHLNTLLLKYHDVTLADTSQLNIQVLDEISKSQKSILYKPDIDTSNLHMFLDIFENTPQAFFSQLAKTSDDSALMNRTKVVFQLQIMLLKKQNIVFINKVDIIVTAGNSPGMGVLSNMAALTGGAFAEMLNRGMNLLINPENKLAQIEVKAAPAFVADTYFIAKTSTQPKVYVTTTKGISSYAYGNKSEMIRLGEPFYEEIRMKGKKNKLPVIIEDAIKKTNNSSISEYIFLHQESRDVIQNKNYLLKLLVQIDPENPYGSTGLAVTGNRVRYLFNNGVLINPENTTVRIPQLLTNFLAGNIHYLFNEKDTVAIFSIEKAVPDFSKKINLTTITNGFDSSDSFSFYKRDLARTYENAYAINGKINKFNFSIKCSGFGNTVKEIYLNDKLICIAQGKFTPEKFVFFDASISPELVNQLIIIGFNPFFE